MSIPFILLALACSALPGLAVCVLLNIKENRLLHSIAFSYSLFFIVFSLFSYLEILEKALSAATIVILVTSVFFLFIAYSRKRLSLENTQSMSYVVGIVFISLLYNLFFGAASDLPSDLYAHMERFQRALSDLNSDLIDSQFQSTAWLKQGYVWYYFLAVLSTLTKASSTEVLESVGVVTNSLFFISLFSFSRTIFQSHKSVNLVAVFVCLFTAAHMGISVFSFARYYAFGPTMIGFCIYFAATCYFLESITKYSFSSIIKNTSILLVYVLVCIGNHIQEALFIVVMCSIMILILSCRCLPARSNLKSTSVTLNNLNHRCIHGAAILVLLGFCTLYTYTILSSDRSLIEDLRLWNVSELFGVLPSFTILNISHQFIQVITLWGCLVYLLFLLNYRRYKHNVFIVAGMISPFFTVLNPLFVDLFLHRQSFTTLWRLSYLLTIHFVAADLCIYYYKKARHSTVTKQVVSISVIGLLIGLLLPFQNTWQGVHFSRLPTLSKTAKSNSYQYYSDLIAFLDTQDKNTIVTDPITGYLVAAMTHHQSPRRKFFIDYKYNHFSFLQYDENTLKKYQSYLMLVNKREQALSNIGSLSGHWPENQLRQIHSYYPPALIEHIADDPKSFEQLWSNNGIAVYRIN